MDTLSFANTECRKHQKKVSVEPKSNKTPKHQSLQESPASGSLQNGAAGEKAAAGTASEL